MSIAYRPQASDTSIAADRLRFAWLRQRSPANRLEMAAALNRSARELSLSILRQRFADLSETDFARKVVQVWLGGNAAAVSKLSGFEPRGEVMS
jgi:hypothetical protein